MTKEEIKEKAFDKFTDDLWTILSTYVEAISPQSDELEQAEIVDDVIRKLAKYYSKH